jgi:hypothetical protein
MNHFTTMARIESPATGTSTSLTDVCQNTLLERTPGFCDTRTTEGVANAKARCDRSPRGYGSLSAAQGELVGSIDRQTDRSISAVAWCYRMRPLIGICVVLYTLAMAGVSCAAHQIVDRFGVAAGLVAVGAMYATAFCWERRRR